jgi:hypothetical protein
MVEVSSSNLLSPTTIFYSKIILTTFLNLVSVSYESRTQYSAFLYLNWPIFVPPLAHLCPALLNVGRNGDLYPIFLVMYLVKNCSSFYRL